MPLLTLRRFIGVPLPGTDWRIRAMVRPDPDTVRVYLAHGNRTLGIDLAVRDDTGTPRTVGWWAASKLIALLRPEEPTTLAAHRVHDARDPLCEAVYDLTNWA
ncbi:hypothetical protein ACFY7H_24845 [Streptomyces sp. NPDC012794]|uniref:hypothetical protein n=1 Tax=Streptomyces sp. NPDC012794 TaxID=3364850 RepID=UPI0036C622F8